MSNLLKIKNKKIIEKINLKFENVFLINESINVNKFYFVLFYNKGSYETYYFGKSSSRRIKKKKMRLSLYNKNDESKISFFIFSPTILFIYNI